MVRKRVSPTAGQLEAGGVSGDGLGTVGTAGISSALSTLAPSLGDSAGGDAANFRRGRHARTDGADTVARASA